METKLEKIEDKVKEILIKEPVTRKDDCFLIFKYIEKCYPRESIKSFEQVMKNGKENGICFESITRARRRIQAKHPELADKETKTARNLEQSQYREYAKG